MPTTGRFRCWPPIDPVEDGITEREDAAVRRHQPVAAAVSGGGDVDHRGVEVLAAHGAVEPGVAEGEDAAVGCDQPVAPPSGVATMWVMGAFRCWPAIDP